MLWPGCRRARSTRPIYRPLPIGAMRYAGRVLQSLVFALQSIKRGGSLENHSTRILLRLRSGSLGAGFHCRSRRAAAHAETSEAHGHRQVVNSDGTPGGKAETYLVEGKLFGRVTEVRPGRTPRDVCDKCSGEYKNQLILGMVMMRNFHPEGDDWVGGTVVDPENGKEYKGKIWAVGKDSLHMRGFIGISLLGRTESWVRIP